MITAKVKTQDVNDEPEVFAQWQITIDLQADFDIRRYCEFLNEEGLEDFYKMIEAGEMTDDVLDYIGDDVNDQLWRHIPKDLTLKINEVELRNWIDHKINEKKEN